MNENYPWHFAVAITDVIMNTRTEEGDVTYCLAQQVAITGLNTVFAQRAACEDQVSNQALAAHCHVLFGWSDDIGLLALQARTLAAAFRQGIDYVRAPFPLHVCAPPCPCFGLHGSDRCRLPVAWAPPSTSRMRACVSVCMAGIVAVCP
jgi:hypothetical protein